MTRPKLTIRRQPKPAAPTPIPRLSPVMGLPPVSSVCEPCGVYVIRPEVHAGWHAREDAKAARWERVRDLVLRVFLARGYITTDENTTPVDGNA